MRNKNRFTNRTEQKLGLSFKKTLNDTVNKAITIVIGLNTNSTLFARAGLITGFSSVAVCSIHGVAWLISVIDVSGE
jgi:hypothetical protein